MNTSEQTSEITMNKTTEAKDKTQPNNHDTIVLEWDETGKVTYCRTFDFPSDEGNMRAAISSVGLNNRRYIIGKIDGILHLSKFKEDE